MLPSDTSFNGVPAIFKQAVDDLIRAGAVPMKILNTLRAKYQNNLPVFALLPQNAKTITNRKRVLTLRINGPDKMASVADLHEYTSNNILPESVDEAKKMAPAALVILKGGVYQLSQAHGFSFSCRALLENFLSARAAWGVSIPLETDGTYKLLYNGWVLLTLGTHSVYYDKNRRKTAHQFRPLSFMFCTSESQEAYEFLFRSTADTIRFMFAVELVPSNTQSDRADAIRNAFQTVWPGSTWTTCWPHISCKVTSCLP
jgi:hypothetical protein